MPTVNFRLHTGLTADTVMAALTDFSDNRARVWPNIDAAHYRLHARGDGWADVTEGNSLAGGIWERNRYDWDLTAGRLTIRTLESNTWAPGSRWIYQLQPAAAGGTDVEVKVVRNGQGFKGMLVGIAIGLFGARMLRSDMEKVLARVANP